MFTAEEISELKRTSTGHLRLLGFKPLTCLEDYHNLRPSTFVFPSDEVIVFSILYVMLLDYVLCCAMTCFMNRVDGFSNELCSITQGSLQFSRCS